MTTKQTQTLQEQIDNAVKGNIVAFRKQVLAEGLRGPALASFDAKMAAFRQRFVQKATTRIESLMMEIGKDMMAELEVEFGRIVRH